MAVKTYFFFESHGCGIVVRFWKSVVKSWEQWLPT